MKYFFLVKLCVTLKHFVRMYTDSNVTPQQLKEIVDILKSQITELIRLYNREN